MPHGPFRWTPSLLLDLASFSGLRVKLKYLKCHIILPREGCYISVSRVQMQVKLNYCYLVNRLADISEISLNMPNAESQQSVTNNLPTSSAHVPPLPTGPWIPSPHNPCECRIQIVKLLYRAGLSLMSEISCRNIQLLLNSCAVSRPFTML